MKRRRNHKVLNSNAEKYFEDLSCNLRMYANQNLFIIIHVNCYIYACFHLQIRNKKASYEIFRHKTVATSFTKCHLLENVSYVGKEISRSVIKLKYANT